MACEASEEEWAAALEAEDVDLQADGQEGRRKPANFLSKTGQTSELVMAPAQRVATKELQSQTDKSEAAL